MKAVFWRPLAIVLRVIYAFIIIADFLRSRYLRLSLYTLAFLILLGVAYLERKDRNYYPVDASLLALFLLAWFSPLLGLHLDSSVLGPDKAFHFAGGALVAWFAAVYYRNYISPPWVRAGTVVLAALAIGAGWEVVEYIYYLIDPRTMPITLQDSVLDLVADALGGCLAAFLGLAKSRRERS